MTVGLLSFGAPPRTVGKANLDLGATDAHTPQTWTNALLGSQIIFTTATPAAVDSYNFPVANFTGSVRLQPWNVTGSPVLFTSTTYRFKWGVGRSYFKLFFNNAVTISNISPPGVVTVTNNGGINATATSVGGTAGTFDIVFTDPNSGVDFSFDGSYTSWNSNVSDSTDPFVMYRVADEARWSGGEYFTTEFINYIRALKPESIRTMGWMQPRFAIQSNEASWATRSTYYQMSYGADQAFPTGNRSGGVTGLGSITSTNGAYTAAAAVNTPLSGWQDGETLYGDVAAGAGSMTVTGAVSGTGGKIQLSIATVSLTGNTTSSSTTVSGLSTTTGLLAGQAFYGTGIPAGAFIVSINTGASTLVLSVAATATNTGASLTAGSVAGLTAGNTIYIQNVSGTTEANGYQLINSVDTGANTVTVNTNFVNAYSGSGGRVAYQTLSITGKTGGAKVILNFRGYPFNANEPGSQPSLRALYTGAGTFIYSKAHDAVIYQQGGTTITPPIEAQIQLANRVNANLWLNLSILANDDYWTQCANLVYAGLNSHLKFIPELSNEVWNSQFTATYLAGNASLILGLGASTVFPFQGLRLRQINGTILPATNWSGSMSRVVRNAMFQGGVGGLTGGGTSNAVGMLAGTSLVSPGSALYQAYVGGAAVNYDTSPNRPVDFVNEIGYAPYVTGLGLPGPDASYTPTVYDLPALQSIYDDWTGGSTAAAIATVNSLIVKGRNRVQTVTWDSGNSRFVTPLAHNISVNDMIAFDVSGGTAYSNIDTENAYQVLTVPTSATFTAAKWTNGAQAGGAVNPGSAGSGTMNVGFTGSGNSMQFSLFSIANGFYTKWQNVAASGSTWSPAPALGQPSVRWYEGAIEPDSPTAAQLTAIGIVGSASAAETAIDAAIVAWKNDVSSSAAVQAYFASFMGTDANYVTFGTMSKSIAPSWLVLYGPGVWSLTANAVLGTAGSVVQPYQLYYGFQAFSA